MTDLFEKRYTLQSSAREILGKSRLDVCNRIRINKNKNIAIRKTGDRYSFGNLAQCGSVWACPVCSAKITERRRAELSVCLSNWVSKGKKLLFITFTLQHDINNTCADVLDKLLKGYGLFWSSRKGKAICKDFSIVGRIRSLETTYGVNGWHCHIHVLCFVDVSNEKQLSETGIDTLSFKLKEHWVNCLIDTGAIASIERGVTVKNADEGLAEYIAKFGFDKKWGMSRELTKPNSKHADGVTPFQILDLYSENQWQRHLFREYVSAFYGKSQLRWSKGTRKLLELPRELTDVEIVNKPESETVTVGEIEYDAWRIVLGNDIRGECLNALQGGIKPFEVMLRGHGITAYNSKDKDYPVFDCLPF